MAAHSSILACEIPWTEEPGRLQSTGPPKSRTRLSDWTELSNYTTAAVVAGHPFVWLEHNIKAEHKLEAKNPPLSGLCAKLGILQNKTTFPVTDITGLSPFPDFRKKLSSFIVSTPLMCAHLSPFYHQQTTHTNPLFSGSPIMLANVTSHFGTFLFVKHWIMWTGPRKAPDEAF